MLRIGKSIKVSEKDYDKTEFSMKRQCNRNKKTFNPLRPGGYAFNPENWTLTMKGTDGSEIILSQTALTLISDYIGNRIEVTGEGYIR